MTIAARHLMIMAYGGPNNLDEVRPYLLDVRNFRPTSDHIVNEISDRYRLISGRSPILELTNAQAVGIERALNEQSAEEESWKVWVGMRHWHPYIKDVLSDMTDAGVTEAIGLVMAPHFSQMSIGAYFKRAAEAESPIQLQEILSWNLLPRCPCRSGYCRLAKVSGGRARQRAGHLYRPQPPQANPHVGRPVRT
jgi:ferrochelatase